MGGFAAVGLELEGGVGDVEAVPEDVLDGLKDDGAVGDGHLPGIERFHGDVAGEGDGAGAEIPDMEVMDVGDTGDGLHDAADIFEGEVPRGAFEEDVEVSRTMPRSSRGSCRR